MYHLQFAPLVGKYCDFQRMPLTPDEESFGMSGIVVRVVNIQTKFGQPGVTIMVDYGMAVDIYESQEYLWTVTVASSVEYV